MWIYSKFCSLNLLLVQSHQAEIIIVKRLNQGRNNVTRLRVEPRSCDQSRRKNDVFTLSPTLSTDLLGGVGGRYRSRVLPTLFMLDIWKATFTQFRFWGPLFWADANLIAPNETETILDALALTACNITSHSMLAIFIIYGFWWNWVETYHFNCNWIKPFLSNIWIKSFRFKTNKF